MRFIGQALAACSAVALLGWTRGVTAEENGDAFFQSQVLPILEHRCYDCHSHASGKAEGGLVLDSRMGWQTGGDSGPALVPGDVSHSRLLRAVRREEQDFQMPPKEKLSAAEVHILEQWIQTGAADPRTGIAQTTPGKRVIDIEQGRKFWCFQPIAQVALPSPGKRKTENESPIDAFIRDRLTKENLAPSPRATARSLIRRVYFDLIGLPPTYEEVEAFAQDDSPAAFAQLVDRLLARAEYGQRWGRHWLDVARYSDTTEQSVDGERRIPFAHTYRDYVIDALNQDKPFDRFVLEQIAADRLPDAKKEDLRALGFLTVGRRFQSNIEAANLVIDDRIDVIGRGFLGLTLACARCHDHKFDPIPTADYYSLFGILGSVREPMDLPEIRRELRTAAMDEYDATRAKLLREWDEHVDRCVTQAGQHFRAMAGEYLRYLVRSSPNHRTTEGVIPYDTPKGLLFYQAPARWQTLLEQSRSSGEPFFKLWHVLMALPREGFAAQAQAALEKMAAAPGSYHPWVLKAFAGKAPADILEVADIYGGVIHEAVSSDSVEGHGITELLFGVKSPIPPQSREEVVEDMPRFITEHCLMHRSDGEAGMKILTQLSALEATAPVERPMAVQVSAKPLDAHVLIRGDMKHLGTAVPRKFLTVLSNVDARTYADDGRLQLAQAIVSPKNPLTARVIVNRIWQHHFGLGLVATSDNFGVMGEKPSHPELLDYLAQWFMEHGWSLKALHRLILNSATWQQSSVIDEGALTKDPSNRLLWRMTPRRLEFEPMRDSLLFVAGRLNETFGGRSQKLSDGNHRRAVYGYTDRFRIPALLRNFDVANPDTSISRRSETLVPLQALYLFNSNFVHQQAEALLNRREMQAATDRQAHVRTVFHLVLSRDPAPEELQMSDEYLGQVGLDASAAPQWIAFIQALMLSNEFVFTD